MANSPCRLRVPPAGRDQLCDQIETWAKANRRTVDVMIQDDLWVTIDNDPDLCAELGAYFTCPAYWEDGFEKFRKDLGALDGVLRGDES
ncbi:hypothetical protein D7W81_19105 [Corallococcus aberystwythensis]|uniref:Uncharacterized protein n=2 Tax=Corallococcus aberystwythensis TaxID=2316722 RepID=A0A3A8Q5Z7_9BACT|nr:hypothetical protein D7W81_19105 [Corallococcus aberystwythensis]